MACGLEISLLVVLIQVLVSATASDLAEPLYGILGPAMGWRVSTRVMFPVGVSSSRSSARSTRSGRMVPLSHDRQRAAMPSRRPSVPTADGSTSSPTAGILQLSVPTGWLGTPDGRLPAALGPSWKSAYGLSVGRTGGSSSRCTTVSSVTWRSRAPTAHGPGDRSGGSTWRR